MIQAAITERAAEPVWVPGEIESAISGVCAGAIVVFLLYQFIRRVPWPGTFRLRFALLNLAAALATGLSWFVLSVAFESVFTGSPWTTRSAARGLEIPTLGVFLYTAVAWVAYSVQATTQAVRAEAAASARMSLGSMTPPPTLRAGAAASPKPARHRVPSGYLLIHAAGWLVFGVAMMIIWTDLHPWHVALAMTPGYIVIGFVLSLLLGPVYDRLGVGPASFGSALAVIVAGSYVAGSLWTMAFAVYRHGGAADTIHSLIIGGPSSLSFRREWLLDGGVINSLPLFAMSVVRLGLQYNTALREQREQALRAVAAARDAQLRMLAYQLNPHFLFNTLNSIRALINEDGKRARDMVTALAGYLRYALVERPLHVALLEEEVASVRGYLAIEQVRFEERLDARLEIEPAALRCEVPAFLLNPLVENAVKHGVAGTAGAPLVLRVEARLAEPDRLRLVVENTGSWAAAPTPPSAAGEGEDGLPGGVGLANVRARLAALHPEDHRIQVDEADGRVRVVVELPARFRGEVAK
jgi:hypothetical protein